MFGAVIEYPPVELRGVAGRGGGGCRLRCQRRQVAIVTFSIQPDAVIGNALPADIDVSGMMLTPREATSSAGKSQTLSAAMRIRLEVIVQVVALFLKHGDAGGLRAQIS